MSDDDTPALPDLGAMLGGLDMGSLLGMAQNLQSQMEDAQNQLASTVVTGTAASGSVTIEMTGGWDATSVRIDPALVNPDEVDLLEDLVVAALRDAIAQVRAVQESASPMSGLGGLGAGLLGAGAPEGPDE